MIQPIKMKSHVKKVMWLGRKLNLSETKMMEIKW